MSAGYSIGHTIGSSITNTFSRYLRGPLKAAGLAALVAFGCGGGTSSPPKGGTLEDQGIHLTPDSSEVVTEMDDGGEEISYAKGKVLLQVSAGTKDADLESLLQKVNGQITGYIQPLNSYEIQVPDAKTALPEIRQHPLVQNAELNYAGSAEELDIDDPEIQDFAWGHHQIKLSEAYEFIGERSLAEVTVAVLDSGFDLEHPELASQFLPGVDVGSVDDNPTYEDISEDFSNARQHGTLVAGIIAMLNNGKDLNGVAYNTKILPVKVSSSGSIGKAAEGASPNNIFAFKVAAGIAYAALEGAEVINMSLGWYSSSPSWLLQSAVEYAQAEGVSVVASAGNENKDAEHHYPSALSGIISVGATTKDDKRWTYSESQGSNYSLGNDTNALTVAAPGHDIWSASAGDRGDLAITDATGTSLAAPFVAGLDALVKSLKPSLSAEERRQIIIDSADEIKVAYPGLDYPNSTGDKTWKRINAYNAVVLAETGCNPTVEQCGGGNKGKWIEVSANRLYTCGIKDDETVKCWGYYSHAGRTGPPPGKFIHLSCGELHGCGIKDDNMVACWGDDYGGATNPPSGVFTKISSGGNSSCAIDINGLIDCWGLHGWNFYSDIYSEVSVGFGYVCGLKIDGTIICLGHNDDGQASSPAGQFLHVSAGYNHTCGIRENKTVECWGENYFGETDAPAGEFLQVSAGENHTCGIKTDQTIECWGLNGYRQISTPPQGKFIQIDAGTWHTCAVAEDHTIRCWGENEDGESTPPE